MRIVPFVKDTKHYATLVVADKDGYILASVSATFPDRRTALDWAYDHAHGAAISSVCIMYQMDDAGWAFLDTEDIVSEVNQRVA